MGYIPNLYVGKISKQNTKRKKELLQQKFEIS